MRVKTYNDVQVNVKFTKASTRTDINIVTEQNPTGETNENIALTLGKISKWYEALVPTGGSSGKILAWNSSGTAKWSDPLHPTITKSTDTTSTASPAHGGTFTAVDSVTRDDFGHVTKINTKTVTLPNDTKVTQSSTTTGDFRPIVLGMTHTTNPENLETTVADQTFVTKHVFVQPSTGNLTLYSTSGDSPSLIFRRGTMIDGELEWRIRDTSGRLEFDRDISGSAETWENILRLDPTNNKMYFKNTEVSLSGHTHNYAGSSSAGGAATNFNTTVTNGSESKVQYGIVFVADPNVSEANVARKNNDFRLNLTNGTTSSAGMAELVLGNNKSSTTADNKQGVITLYSKSTSYHVIMPADTTTAVQHDLPATGGTVLNTGTTSFTQTLSSGTKIGTIKINGTSTDIYCETNINTDTKVTQTAIGSTYTNYRPLVISSSNSSTAPPTATTTTDGTFITSGIYCQPSTSTIFASDFKTTAKIHGYWLKDSTATEYPGVYDNGANMWIGSTQTAARHHVGSTYISAGHNGTNGNPSIFVSVPNAANDGGTNYAVIHAGNFTTTGSGNAITSVAFTNNVLTFSKGATFAASDHTHSQYLPKTTYEWNKEISFGQNGYLKIGSFPMYDTNITIDINATTSATYHGTVVIATQNVSTTSMGSHKIHVYDDPTGHIANALRIVWTSGSRNFNIYFVPQAWSKNFIHIRALGQYMDGATDICVSQTGTAPDTTSGLEPVNILSVSSSGSGNAVTGVSINSLGNLSVSKDSTFLTSHQSVTDGNPTLSWETQSTVATIGSTDIHVTMPPNPNTDTKVNVTLATTTKAYLLGTSTTPTSSAQAVTSVADTGVYLGTTAGMLCVNGTICANAANNTAAGGLSLYGTDPETYGVMFRQTSYSGKHGYVQSDWATYFTMNQGATTRGWIFRRKTDGCVASISGAGNAVFNGSVTVGGDTTNTSGCRMQYNSTTQSLDFVFV